MTEKFNVKKAPFGWRFSGAGMAACGALGILLYIHSKELAGLIWGIFFIALGTGILFVPFYEKEKT